MARRKYGWRIAGFVFKGVCMLLILGIIGLLAWRIIDRNVVPSAVKTITPNDRLCEAYEKNDGKLTMFYQEQSEYTREEKNYGYFANSGTVFIEEAAQLQFVLRYNNSTLKYTAADYALEEEPSRDENIYDVTVTVMYDLTPDNDKDNDGKTEGAVRYERFYPTGDQISYKKTLYNYRKFIFDDIKIDDSVLAVMVDIYYVGDLDYEETPYATLLLYYYEDKAENIEYKLTSADKKAIEKY